MSRWQDAVETFDGTVAEIYVLSAAERRWRDQSRPAAGKRRSEGDKSHAGGGYDVD
ncbi:hypothetical protein NKH85_27905 [Mesorhizobium sp. M0924]|uniref:hypothetical protein n=1 Tax=unclassified Mesorhizobium TaxID=325217 RepID=UPI0003D05FBA|nr:hypothetical protein [Mesorhizobium sp. L103C119B0]ESZ71603.1 hypothetical protein X727_10090 [Mesorhizobium sp. L103C119B0]